MKPMLRQPTKRMVQQRARDIAEYLEYAPINSTPCMEESELLCSLTETLSQIQQTHWCFGYSDFTNTGDQALWFALNRIFETVSGSKEFGCLIQHPSDLKLHPDGNDLVFFPGGGSLGNRYNSSRRRIALLEINPLLRFFQMPVSTSFSDEKVILERLRSVYSRRDSKLFVRDSRSKLEADEKIGVNSIMVPDLVEFLPCCESFSSRDFGTLYLLRTDQESAGAGKVAARNGLIASDWEDFVIRTRMDLKLRKALFKVLSSLSRRSSVLNSQRNLSQYRYRLSRSFALHDTAMALSYLSFFERVVTDRLHGIILSRNLGLEIEAIDNDHGKLYRYTNTWEQRYRRVAYRESLWP